MESIRGAVNPREAESDSDWELLLASTRARARALCRNSQVEPDDLAQEALARLLLDLDRVRDRRSWLARVMVNLLVSELRRNRVRSDQREELRGFALGDSEDPAHLDLRLDLRRHARALSVADRRCLRLYAAGHSHREIAARLGQPVHRIGPCIARAVARLRRSLETPS
jgi:RNA polymerase sigma factor (sigma-70 family)